MPEAGFPKHSWERDFIMNQSYLKDFNQPGAAFRGKPFWAWNGKLEPAELQRQIRLIVVILGLIILTALTIWGEVS